MSDETLSSTCELAYLCLPQKGPLPLELNFSFQPMMLVFCGLCWTMAYIVSLISGRDGTYHGVPYASMILFLTWEFIFSFLWTEFMPTYQLVVNRIWFTLDFLLFLQYARQAYRQCRKSPSHLIRSAVLHSLMTISMVALMTALIVELHDYRGVYTAFGANLVTSTYLAWEMWTAPPKADMQWAPTVGAGIFRAMGTSAVSVAVGQVIHASSKATPFLMVCFVGCFVWDTIYVLVALAQWSNNKALFWKKEKVV